MKPDAVVTNSEESEDEAVVAYREQLRRRRRALWRISVGVGLVFLGVLAFVTYTDAPPPEVSDLTRREPWPAADPEGYHARLSKLADSLPQDGVVPSYEPRDLPDDSPDWMPDGWRGREDYVDFRDFLAAGRGWTPSRLARWDVGLACLVDDCAELMEIEERPASYGVGEASWEAVEIGSQLMVAAGMYLKAGYTGKAVDALMLAYRMGGRTKKSRAGLRAYHLGVGVQSAAIRNLARLVVADEEAARLVAEAWWKHERSDAPDVLAEAIRMEYRVFATQVDALNAEGASSMAPDVFRWLAKTRVLYPLVMKPNLTKGLYADYLRQQAEWCDLPWTDYEARGGYRLLMLEPRDLFRPVNLYGRVTAWHATSPDSAYSRRVEYRSAVSVFEAVLGLRLYHAEHGALPETLDALVPRYLPAVPVDYHDGAAIRYSRASAEVWSAGKSTERLLLDFATTPKPAP